MIGASPTSCLNCSDGGNFEGAHHLIRRERGELSEEAVAVGETLLSQRRTRPQPEVDGKIVTAWNALAGVGLVIAGRAIGQPDYIAMARRLRNQLLESNADLSANTDGTVTVRLARSSLGGNRSNGEFLEDYAAMLLLETYLCEHLPAERSSKRSSKHSSDSGAINDSERDSATGDSSGAVPSAALRRALETAVLRFRDSGDAGNGEEPVWNLSRADDFVHGSRRRV